MTLPLSKAKGKAAALSPRAVLIPITLYIGYTLVIPLSDTARNWLKGGF